MVENSAMFSVTPARPAAKVKVSNDHSRLLSSPPKPFQRAIGMKNSMPARSAICATSTISLQRAGQRSGTRVSARPPSELAENTPSLNLFGPRIGCGTPAIHALLGTRRAVYDNPPMGKGSSPPAGRSAATRTREWGPPRAALAAPPPGGVREGGGGGGAKRAGWGVFLY